MNNTQKKILVAYFFANCIIVIFAPSIITTVIVTCITVFLYFKYK